MANKVGINISGLKADKKAFESRLGNCRSITRMLTNGINAMERGLDKTRLQNVKTKMDSVLEVQHTLERYYEWAIRVIDECIEKYQSVDSILEKHADDMYDKNGNIVNPSIGSETGNSNSDQEVKNGFEAKVDEMKEKDGFKQGDYNYNNFMSYVSSYNGHSVEGAQCYAMAHMMQIEVLGARGYNCGTTSFDDIKVGDVIHYKGGGADANWGHWVFVTDVQPGKIVVSEANWDPPYGGTVSYGREITKGSIEIQEIRRV